MSKTAPTSENRKALRTRFKSAQAKRGFDGIRDTLTRTQVAMLSCEQALKALALLDERIVEAKEEAKAEGTDGNAVGKPAADHLAELRTIENQVLLGIIANPDMHAEYERLFKVVRGQAALSLPDIWGQKARRNYVNDKMESAFEELLLENEDFAKIRYAMQRAADALLEESGMRKLGAFWDERLKSGLFPCPKPLHERIEIRTRFAPDPDDTSHAVHMLKEDVRTSIDRLPDYLYRFIDESGYTIRVAERLAYIDRQYAVEALKAAARSHDVSSKGVHVGGSRYIDIPLLNVRGDGEVFMACSGRDDMDMTLAHEAFHGIGEFMGDIDANDPELVDAFAADLAQIRTWDISGFEYDAVRDYLPKAMGGIRECEFAARIEAFAEIGGEKALGYNDNFIGDCFERTASYMGALAGTLDVVYDICPNAGMMPKPSVLEKRIAPDASAGSKPACFIMN